MRWFTPQVANLAGTPLTDEESDARCGAYSEHLGKLLPDLPEPLLALARDHDLHDGRVVAYVLNPPERVELSIVCGDLQRGYRRLTLDYRCAELTSATDAATLPGLLDDQDTELLYDEIDRAPDGRFEHRHLLWPRGEFGVRFRELRLHTQREATRP